MTQLSHLMPIVRCSRAFIVLAFILAGAASSRAGTVPTTVSGPGITFTTASSSAVGSNPRSLAAGDFNGDGRSDIVVANSYESSVSVLLSNGDGTFASQATYAVAAGPVSVAIGDFNADGKMDLVTANYNNGSGNTVSVLMGNGDGTFQPPAQYGVGTSPFSVAVGDFNGDGKMDLVVANYGANSVSVLVGNGDGTFQSQVSYPVGVHPYSVAVGDFNGDGKMDFVVVNRDANTISVLLGNGDGSFQSQLLSSVGADPASVAVGDFNGDGKLDVVTANHNANSVSVLLGNGDGTFQSQVSYPVGVHPYSVAVGDFDGDGKIDLVATNADSNSVSVLLGTGTGAFTAQATYTVGSFPVSIAAGDFNGDGVKDLACANYLGNNVTVLLGAPTPLGSSLNPSLSGQPVTFTAIVTPQPSGTGTPTGTVTFMDGSTTLGTGTLSGSPDTATFTTTSTLSAGNHNITATYNGDATYAASTTTVTLVQVVKPVHFSVSAASPEAAGSPFNITVTAVDAQNNPVTSYAGTVHFTSSDTHPHTVLPADSTLTNGTGTFSVTLETPGLQTITATDTADPGTTGVSAPIQVGSEPPMISSFAPTSGPVGTSVVITGADFLGTSAVTFTGAGSTTVNAQYTVDSDYQITAIVPAAAKSGIISVTNPSGMDTTASVAPATTDFTVVAGAATQLVFTQGPTTTASGQPITPAVTVQVEDANGNLVTSDNSDTVTLAITGGTGTTGAALNGTASKTVVNGVATFDTLSINQAGVGYTLTASAAGLTGVISSSFDITAGAASQLIFTQGPTTTVAGQTITPVLTVQVEDANGNVLTPDSTDTVTLAITGGTGAAGATLGGTVTQTVANGVASFGDLSILKAGVGYTLTASSTINSAAITVVSNAFNITAAAPTQLAIAQQPTNTASGATITPPVTVQVQDTYGNLAATDSADVVTLAITGGTGTAGATLGGALSQTAVNGVATFNDLSIDKTGTGYTLTASATLNSAAVTVASAAFNITAGASTRLIITQGPTTTTAGQTITPPVTVEIRDANGNLVTTGNNSVTLSTTGGTGTSGAALRGTVTQTAVNGVATFNDLSIDKARTGYTLTATATGLTSAISSSFDITAGAASQLVIAQGPTSAMAGGAITPAVTVQVEDANGNILTADNSDTVTLAITNGTGTSGAALNGTVMQTVVNGVATFSGVSINQAGTGYTLTATAAGLSSATSGPFDITAAAPAKLIVLQGPTTTASGAPITPAATVQVQDTYGNLVNSANNAVTFSISSGTGTAGAALNGTTTQSAVNGVATFSDLSINKAGTGYTLTAAAAGLASAVSGSFDITVGAASQLVFTQGPTTTTAGQPITPDIAVEIRDTNGNLLTSDSTDTVTLTLNGGAGAALNGTLTRTAVGGVVTFNGLSINQAAAGYTLTATLNTGTIRTVSTAFDITPAAAAQIVIVQGPTTTTAGATITPAVTVKVEDAYGNLVNTANNSVALTLSGGTGGATLNGTLNHAAVSGVATFSDLSIKQSGTSYTLTAASAGLSSATSSPFDITPAAPSKLAFAQGPSTTVAGAAITPAVTVQVQDTYGNLVTTSNNSLSLSITGGTGTSGATLRGTISQTAVNGVATFNDLSINQAGTGYTLTAAAAGLSNAVSGPFDITAGAASQLAFVQQPTNTVAGAAMTPALTVQVQDAYGNVLTADNTDSVTLAITGGTGSAGAALQGATTQTAVNGVVTFSGLSITRAGAGYTLTGTLNSGTITTASSAFNITPAAATQMVIIQQPTNTPVGSAMTPAVTLQIQDQYGNLESTDNSDTVTLAITAGTGTAGATLSGTLMQTVVNGVAAFGNLSIDKAGPGYSLTARTTLNGAPLTLVTATFAITGPPTITTISPTNTPVQTTPGPGITLIVNGTNFENTYSVLKWNGSARVTTYISPTQLKAAIPASDLRTAGSASVTVTNNPNGSNDPNAGTSNAVIFRVGSPNLILTLPTPMTRNAATGAYTVNVRISNTGTLDASNLQVTGASTISGTPYINSATQTALPTASSTIAVGNHQDFTFTFSGSAGARGAVVTIWIRGTYNSGTAFSITTKGTLP